MKKSPLYLSLFRVALGTGMLLLIPCAAMQFRIGRPLPRAAAIAAIAIVFDLMWAKLAVGLFR